MMPTQRWSFPAGFALLLTIALGGRSSPGQLIQSGFDFDPRPDGWVLSDWALQIHSAGGWSASGGQPGGHAYNPGGGAGVFWRSPGADITPMDYVKVQFDAQGAGQPWVCGLGLNAAATFGRYPSANAAAGQLVADDWTAFPSPASWTTHTYYTRARVNAAQQAIRLMGQDVKFDNVLVTAAGRDEVRAWAQSVYQSQMPPVNYIPPADRFDRLPRTASRLTSGHTFKIVMLGDSIMNDTGNSPLDVLLEGRRPGTRVEVVTAVGGGTGVDKWNSDDAYAWPSHDLNLQQAVIDQQPDLVLIGGISNGENYDDFRQLIDRIVAGVQTGAGYAPDVMLLTGAFGQNPQDPAGYAAQLHAIADEKNAAFLDMRAVTEQYFADADAQGYARDFFYRDTVHANHLGKQVLGRVLTEHLVPEPTTLALLAAAGLLRLPRRRVARRPDPPVAGQRLDRRLHRSSTLPPRAPGI